MNKINTDSYISDLVGISDIGCPKCSINNGIYLVYYNRSIWKVCKKCKSVFYCSDDSVGTFTDWDMDKYLEENPGKSIKDYENLYDIIMNKINTDSDFDDFGDSVVVTVTNINDISDIGYIGDPDETCTKLSTESSIGCPKCSNNHGIYLVYCNRSIWKVCEECKSVFYCSDASGGFFTDWDMDKYLEENPGKSIKDYEKMKIEYIENRFKDYSLQEHPEVTERAYMYTEEYREELRVKRAQKIKDGKSLKQNS